MEFNLANLATDAERQRAASAFNNLSTFCKEIFDRHTFRLSFNPDPAQLELLEADVREFVDALFEDLVTELVRRTYADPAKPAIKKIIRNEKGDIVQIVG
jgi:hypothetical protein